MASVRRLFRNVVSAAVPGLAACLFAFSSLSIALISWVGEKANRFNHVLYLRIYGWCWSVSQAVSQLLSNVPRQDENVRHLPWPVMPSISGLDGPDYQRIISWARPNKSQCD